MSSLERGDKIEWNTSQGITRGAAVGSGTSGAQVKNPAARALPRHPGAKVRSDKSRMPADASKKVGRHDRAAR